MAVIVPIPTLIDLALGSPDVGTVNFSVLHSLLHVLAQQLDLRSLKVEFRGSDSERIQGLLMAAKEETSSATEFKVIAEQELKTVSPVSSREFRVDDGVGTEGSSKTDLGRKKPSSQGSDNVYVVESGKVIDVKKHKPFGAQVSPASFARLEGKVKVLQTQIEMLGAQSIPSNEALLEATRSQTEAKPITELWQSLNITKRMSGAEEGIDKLASLLETLAKEYAELRELVTSFREELGGDVSGTMKEIKEVAEYARKIRPRPELYAKHLKKRETPEQPKKVKSTKSINEVDEAEGPLDEQEEHRSTFDNASVSKKQELSSDKGEGPTESIKVKGSISADKDKKATISKDDEGVPQGDESLEDLVEGNLTPQSVKGFQAQHEYLRRNVEYLTAQVNTLADFADYILPEILDGLPHMEELKHKIAKIRGKTGSEVTLTDDELEAKRVNLTISERLQELEGQIAKHASKLRRQDVTMCERTGNLGNLVKTLESKLETVQKKLFVADSGSGYLDELANNPVIKAINHKLEGMDKVVEEVSKANAALRDDTQCTETSIASLTDQVELMKTSKVERFELDDVLAEKADCSLLNMKVSQDQFDAAYTEFSKWIDDALEKILQQDANWKARFNDLSKIVDMKLNIAELDPLKEEFNEKIENLRARIHSLADIKEGKYAAGTKKKLLRNVNCISCDEDAIMKVQNEIPSIPAPAPIPAHKNMRPFITYELDNLRKMQAKSPDAHNMNFIANIMRNTGRSKQIQKREKFHLTNRYVGGSHTQIFPDQKVPHSGPILNK